VFYSISKALEGVPEPLLWAAPLLVLALLLRKRPRIAVPIAIAALLPPVVLASPAVASALERWAERSAPATVRPEVEYDAAIVLSGKPEARISSAARLVEMRRARFLLYSGSLDVRQAKRLIAKLRPQGVRDDQVLFESKSRNTRENAVQSARVVQQHGWKRLVLVTGAIHGRRALACFHKVGLDPDFLPATTDAQYVGTGLFPRREALAVSSAVAHEVVGYLAYRLAGYVH
jgi:uncharacterized SAM-binding protein YcdF (DUF218 family)